MSRGEAPEPELYDLVEVAACGLGDGPEVVEDLPRARLEVTADKVHRLRVERNLPGQEHEVSGPDRLGIGAYCCGRVVAVNGFFAHLEYGPCVRRSHG